MIPKIIINGASVIAQNKKDRIRVLSRGAGLKSMRHSRPASLLGSSINMPATRLEKRQRTAQSNHTQGYVAHLRKSHHRLLLGNSNVLTLRAKKLELVEKAKKYHLNFVRVFSTKRHGSEIVDLDSD